MAKELATKASTEMRSVAALAPEVISSIVLKGDISGLSQTQMVEYYNTLCNRLGLDPSTQPFKLMNLNGKKMLYAGRECMQQLSMKHHVSHKIISREKIDDAYCVIAQASTPDGRVTESIGAVAMGTAKGDMFANLLMKAETKSKRRATFDLLGLGMLDETEVESIKDAVVIETATPAEKTAVAEAVKRVEETTGTPKLAADVQAVMNAKDARKMLDEIDAIEMLGNVEELDHWQQENLASIKALSKADFAKIVEAGKSARKNLTAKKGRAA